MQKILPIEQKQIMDMESRLVVAKEEGSVMDREFGVGWYKLLQLVWISNGVLLYSAGN